MTNSLEELQKRSVWSYVIDLVETSCLGGIVDYEARYNVKIIKFHVKVNRL